MNTLSSRQSRQSRRSRRGAGRLVLGATLAVAGALAAAPQAGAEDAYPSKPITIIVPYPPGGSNDTFARIVAKEIGEALKQTVIIDNRPGASGNTGTGIAAKAAPDGYTLVAVSSSMTTNAAVQDKLPYDAVKSFAPVAMLAQGPFIVAVNNDFPARTPQELVNAIRANPGKFNYASSGPGSVNQFGTELLKAKAGKLAITHVPYRGMGPAITDLIGNQTQVLISSGPSLLPMVRAGKVRAVGITSLQPSPVAPDLAPMASAVPGYEFELWWGLLAPAGTPEAAITRLNAAVNQALEKPSVKAAILREGAEAKPGTPRRFAETIAADVARWKQLARQQNIVAD